ncbi:hypothetical protein BH23ACT5_BH23ACT5_09950 [soil metagenome]
MTTRERQAAPEVFPGAAESLGGDGTKDSGPLRHRLEDTAEAVREALPEVNGG